MLSADIGPLQNLRAGTAAPAHGSAQGPGQVSAGKDVCPPDQTRPPNKTCPPVSQPSTAKISQSWAQGLAEAGSAFYCGVNCNIVNNICNIS